MGRARDLANILSSSGNVALDSEMGLSLITPTSITATGGSGSITATGAVSFTSVSAISLDGVFSTTYDNYMVQINTSAVSGSEVDLSMYMRDGSGDKNTNINTERIFQYSSSITGQETSQMNLGLMSSSYPNFPNYTVFINQPFLSRRTTFNSTGGYVTPSGVPRQFNSWGYLDLDISVTGVKFYPSSGTFSGIVRVYGIKK
jgi:hypothetical protein